MPSLERLGDVLEPPCGWPRSQRAPFAEGNQGRLRRGGRGSLEGGKNRR